MAPDSKPEEKSAATGSKTAHLSREQGIAAAPVESAAFGALQISSSPFGAVVSIDGVSNPDWQTPFAARKLKPGKHTVKFVRKGYQPETRQVDVVAGQKLPLIVQLQVAHGFVALSSNPSGASIYIDGRDSGQVTPARLTLDGGQHRIALHKQGFKSQITYAEVTAGQTFGFAPNLAPGAGAEPQPATTAAAPQGQTAGPFRKTKRFFGKAPAEDGVLEVRTRPNGAEILLGTSLAPSKTPAKLAVVPGTYQLTLRLPGHKPITRSVQIEKGKTMGVEEIFEPK